MELINKYRGFNKLLQLDKEEYGGGDNVGIDEDFTGSDLQVLVDEHIEVEV